MIKSDTLKAPATSTILQQFCCLKTQTMRHAQIILATKLIILFCNYEHRHKLFCVFFQKTRYLSTSSLIYLNIATQGLQTRLKKTPI